MTLQALRADYRMRHAVVAAAAVLALAACAADAPPRSHGPTATTLPPCVQLSRVRSFEQLDGRNLVLFAPDRQHAYHVELAASCQGLRPGLGLEVQSRAGRLCGHGDEYLLPSPLLPQPGGGFDSRCRVSAVRPLDASALQELLVAFGVGERGEPAAGEVLQEMP